MKKCIILALVATAAAVAQASAVKPALAKKAPLVRAHENTEWSNQMAYDLCARPLPRVLLIGDSICAGYQGLVRQRLAGKMHVSYWASSYDPTMKAYMKLLEVQLEDAPYAVVHINNGLHAFEVDINAWTEAMKRVIILIRAKQPQAKIVWCTTTPSSFAPWTEQVRELNAKMAEALKDPAMPRCEVDDLFTLLDPLDRKQNWSDRCHHRPAARAKCADQVVASVLKALGK